QVLVLMVLPLRGGGRSLGTRMVRVRTNGTNRTGARSTQPDQRPMTTVCRRVGGSSALRWSDASELPVATHRRGHDLLGAGRLGAHVVANRRPSGHDVVLEPTEPLDLDRDDVAGLHRSAVGGGARQEQVAGLEGDVPGDVGDEVV